MSIQPWTSRREIRWRVDSLATVRMDARFVRADAAKASRRLKVMTWQSRPSLFASRTPKSVWAFPMTKPPLSIVCWQYGKPAIVACFGSPYLIRNASLPLKTWLAAFSTADVAQRAVGRALFGQIGHRRPAACKHSGHSLSIGAGIDVPCKMR